VLRGGELMVATDLAALPLLPDQAGIGPLGLAAVTWHRVGAGGAADRLHFAATWRQRDRPLRPGLERRLIHFFHAVSLQPRVRPSAHVIDFGVRGRLIDWAWNGLIRKVTPFHPVP
jgi:hypothetical protein